MSTEILWVVLCSRERCRLPKNFNAVFPPFPLCQHLLHACLCLFFLLAFLHYLLAPAAAGEGVRSTRDRDMVLHESDLVSL